MLLNPRTWPVLLIFLALLVFFPLWTVGIYLGLTWCLGLYLAFTDQIVPAGENNFFKRLWIAFIFPLIFTMLLTFGAPIL